METSTKTIYDVKETLNEYFKLKLQYETQIMINKKKIMNNTKLSKREKRSEFIKLKPKCINCKRPGGTKFVTRFFHETDKDESFRQYKATCGIIADPCILNITVQIGKTELLPNLLNTIQDELNDIKNNIINHKNKLLFGCISTEDALSQFDTLKEEMSFYTSFYEVYLETYNDIVDNDNKKGELNRTLSDYYIQIDKIKECIKKMNETDNVQYAHDAVVINTDILTPLIDKLRSLKYNEMTVFRNEEANTCNLIQTAYSIENLLYSSFIDKVISYKVGMEVMKKTPGDKTALVVESEEEEEPLLDDIPKLIKKPGNNITVERDEPIYTQEQGQNKVTWGDPDYQYLWDKIPRKLKAGLVLDKEWLSDFMFNCMNSRANRKPCDFTNPSTLIIPPNLLPTGVYDFGNQTYNNAFKTIPKSAQATYLTLYTERDGIKKYNMLIDAMNTLVAKETDFSINRGYL